MSGGASGRIGLGPVFTFEWITSSRRWQMYLERSMFVSILLAALLFVWMSTVVPRYGSSIGYLARLGEGFFLAVMSTQLTLILLAAPAATAGAICLDRARGTILHMLMTDLRAYEIVLGKLVARLTPIVGMLACTFPVLELVALLGGVEPAALVAGLVVSIGVAVLSCSLALAFSLWVGKTHEALLCTYAVLLLWLLAGPISSLLSTATGWWWLTIPRRAEPFFLALAPYWWPGAVGLGDYVAFLLVTCLLSAVLLGLVVLRLRRVCTHQRGRKPRRLLLSGGGASLWRILNRAIPWLTPSLDQNPVVWREWHRSRPSRWTLLVTMAYGALSLVFTVTVILSPSGPTDAVGNALQVAIGLLLLSVTAATSLAEEHVRGSLDLLLSTPLSTWQIVVGKWLGAFRAVPLLAVLPALVIASADYMANGKQPWLCPLMIAFVLACGAAVTSLGLAMATLFPRLGRAVGSTVAIYVLVSVGWCFLAAVMYGSDSQKLLQASPLFWTFLATMEAQRNRMQDVLLAQTLWIIFYVLGAAALLLSTLSMFDRRLGRIDDSATRRCLPGRFLRLAGVIYTLWAIACVFFVLFPSPDPTYLLPLGAALVFTLGLLLLALRASWPLESSRGAQERVDGAEADERTFSLVRSKWASAARPVPAILLLPLLVACYASRALAGDVVALLILVVFMLSISLATVSLGVAIWAWCRRRVWAVILTVMIWGLANTGWVMLGGVGVLDPGEPFLTSVIPFSGVAALVQWMNVTFASDVRRLVWSAGASVGYAAAAAVLFFAAKAACHPRVRGRLDAPGRTPHPRFDQPAEKKLQPTTNN